MFLINDFNLRILISRLAGIKKTCPRLKIYSHLIFRFVLERQLESVVPISLNIVTLTECAKITTRSANNMTSNTTT